jgi:hypothetical protein
MRRLRPLSEAECYARCYGTRDEDVRVVPVRPVRPRGVVRMSGEELRLLFESRLDGRESESEAA